MVAMSVCLVASFHRWVHQAYKYLGECRGQIRICQWPRKFLIGQGPTIAEPSHGLLHRLSEESQHRQALRNKLGRLGLYKRS